MKIRFIGTRANIEARSKKHYLNASMLITYRNKTIMIDCGYDWEKKFRKFKPDAIFITHGHNDHAEGLKKGALCPVFASLQTWQTLKKYDISDGCIVFTQHPLELFHFSVQAYEVEHSIHESAVGYKISAGNKIIFYISDVAHIPKVQQVLKNVDYYIGDGSIVSRALLVRESDGLTGHAPMTEQMKWCKKAGVKNIIFTHCGTEVLRKGDKKVLNELHDFAQKNDIKASVSIAYDGWEIAI